MGRLEIPDDFYEKVEPRIHRRIQEVLRPAKRIVDVGCGDCRLTRRLAESGEDRRVTGVDVNDALFPKSWRRLRCVKADARAMAFLGEGEFDAVISVYSFHELAAPVSFLREAGRLLRSGGRIFVVDFPRGSLAQRLWDERYYTTGEVAVMLRRAGFARIRARRIERRQLTWAEGSKPGRGGKPS